MTASPPHLVLFDLDNTLIDRVGAFRSWARVFVTTRALGDEAEVDWLERADGDGLTPRALLFEQVRLRHRLADSAEELMAGYQRDYPPHIQRPGEETLAALHDLRRHDWKIGIVSNGPPTQLAKIVSTGLDEIVDGWTISEVVGASKPGLEIFRIAASTCGCSLEGAWIVGDSAQTDIAGAAAAGLRSVWMRRGREWEIGEYRPDVIADTISEAVAQILA